MQDFGRAPPNTCARLRVCKPRFPTLAHKERLRLPKRGCHGPWLGGAPPYAHPFIHTASSFLCSIAWVMLPPTVRMFLFNASLPSRLPARAPEMAIAGMPDYKCLKPSRLSYASPLVGVSRDGRACARPDRFRRGPAAPGRSPARTPPWQRGGRQWRARGEGTRQKRKKQNSMHARISNVPTSCTRFAISQQRAHVPQATCNGFET